MTVPQHPDYRALLQRSLLAIDQLEAKLAAAERARVEPIAIVGMACRFPGGANDPASYWQLLRDGVDAVTVVPRDRWDAEAIYDPNPDAVGKSYTKWGGFLDDVTHFDAAFFGISPREAATLDPQHRLLLETTWQALEHAGIAPSSLAGTRAGVFLGISGGDYATLLGDWLGTLNGDGYTASGTARSIASGRLSYFLGIHGPNFAVDTACSSSTVALHNAIQCLRNGDTGLALAGGVSLTLSEIGSILTSRARMMSFDGRCKTFDASADGYVRGEGCGMLVMKRLSDAERDRDRILAIVRGSSINQDGRSSGMTAPNATAQEAVIRDALANASLAPADITLLEAHGTGTALGDPIEMKALGAVFGGPREQELMVSSVKTNIGHLEAAAGIASIIKVILAMRHGTVPPHLHFHTPSPLIPWETLPFRVTTHLQPWNVPRDVPRRAGVNSFGFSGTNAHLILEEAPSVPVRRATPRAQLMLLSALSADALQRQGARYAAFLREPTEVPLGDIAFTAAIGRSHLAQRLAVVATDSSTLATQLEQFAQGAEVPGLITGRFASGEAPEVAFLCSGQGAQYPGMGRELYDSEPVFREALDACAAIVDPDLPAPLLSVMFSREAGDDRLGDTAFTQPALFAIEYALAQLWQSWGVVPTVVMGHSVGEYVAACLAGVFSLQDGLRLIAARGRLMSALPRHGSMVAVFATPDRVREALRGCESEVDIAAVNGPTNVVISGTTAAVDGVVTTLAAAGVESARLQVSHAFHSPAMDPMLEGFGRIAQTVTYAPPSIGLISNVTGLLAGSEIATAAYWRDHARAMVRFSDSIATMHAEGIRTCLEIGPSPVLVGMGQRCAGAESAVWAASLKKGRPDREAMLDAAGRLHVAGLSLAWHRLCDQDAQRAELPTYAFARERYWFDTLPRTQSSARAAGFDTDHPLLGLRIDSPLPLYQTSLALASTPWLGDHRIYGDARFPVTGFVELALAAARDALGDAVSLRDVTLRDGLTIPETGDVTVQISVTDEGADGAHVVRVYSAEAPGSGAPSWMLHLTASAIAGAPVPPPDSVLALPDHDRIESDVDAYYATLAAQGAEYGEAFRCIATLARTPGRVLGRAVLADSLRQENANYLIHPALLDGCLQMLGVGIPWADSPSAADDLCVPIGMASIVAHRPDRPVPTTVWCSIDAIHANATNTSCTCNLLVTDDAGVALLELQGIEMQRVSRASLRNPRAKAATPDWLLNIEWAAAPLPVDATPVGGRWLIVTDGTELAADVAAGLTERGAEVLIAQHASSYQRTPHGWYLDTGDAGQVATMFHDAGQPVGEPWAGIVWMVGADPVMTHEAAGALHDAHRRRIASLLAIVPLAGESGAQFVIVTKGAVAVGDLPPDMASAPFIGLGNVIAAEYPAMRTRRIDVEGASREDTATLLVAAIAARDDNDRIALRSGQRLVARLAYGTLAPEQEPVQRLVITERGLLANLALIAVPRTPPPAGQVEIRVHATGLNFRDVLNALGMYPGDPGPLGNECAGVITAVGDGVLDLQVGDRVVSMIDQSFATHVCAPASLTVRMPDNLSFVEAATIPVTFLTADYALTQLAGMRRGDRVLIHAATGGVGMAALQLARRAGAEVFGTAGTPAKRALATTLGAAHVSDSRSLAFVDDFTRASGGAGMDIVLNSLAGDFIPASLGLLKPGGHFVEIGKTDIWDARTVASTFPTVQYHPLYLGEVTAGDPHGMRARLQCLMQDFASGALTPLPQRVYPLERAEEAFRFMSQGLHTGKIVLAQHQVPTVRSDATYLITGGLGGLGLTCADWLVSCGATSLVLVGRRAPTAQAEQRFAAWRERGVMVTVAAIDVSFEADVASVLDTIATSLPPLRGILHAAGIVDDGVLAEQTLERFERVMAPKVQGTMHLDALTRSLPLDFFVLFSSGASMLGSPGQGNYAAANSFMDAVAAARQATGRHAVSISWGSWADVGMAAELDDSHRRRWAAMGLGVIAPADGVRMLQDILMRTRSANAGAIRLDASRMPRNAGVFFERLTPSTPARRPVRSTTAVTTDGDLLVTLGAAAMHQRTGIITDFLTAQVVRILALPSLDRVPADSRLIDIGMDSLTAMEFRNRVQGEVKVRLSIADLLGGATVATIAQQMLGELALADDVGSLEPAVPTTTTAWEEGSL